VCLKGDKANLIGFLLKVTLQKTNISRLEKRTIIFQNALGGDMLVSKRVTKLRVPGFNTTHFSSSLRHFVPSTPPQLQNPSDSTFLFSTSSSSGVGLNISPASDKLRAAGAFD